MKDKVTILVVDDESAVRDLLARVLGRDGYRVLTVADGAAALRALAETEVAFVISDLKMPGMDGFALLKAIKSEYPNVGVVMMTGYGDIYTIKDAMLLGADEYITKPFRNHEISLVVERAYWRYVSEGYFSDARV